MGKVSVLGTGIMGTGMTHALLRSGHEVTVWNRTAEKARSLADDGAVVAASPAEAVARAETVITVLADGEATETVMKHALSEAPADAVWIQCGTVGVTATDRLAELARDAGVLFVDAPVSGTKAPAENGKLLVLASGPREARDRCRAIFDAIGTSTVWVGDAPGDGSRLKLVVNDWLLGLLVSLGESIAFARSLGLAPETFLETIRGGPLDTPYAQIKGRAMVEGEFPTSFPTKHALKDAELMEEAARQNGLTLHVASVAVELLRTAVAAGHGDEDFAAVATVQTGTPS